MNPEKAQVPGPDEALLPLDKSIVGVYLSNKSAFKGFLRRHLPSDAAAEDILQQGLLKAARSEAGLANKESAVAWFYRILRNLLTDYYRAHAAETRKHESFLHEKVAAGEDSVPAPDEAFQKEICACLNGLLPALKPEYGDLIRRIDLGGEEPLSVAQASGITYNNLMVRLHRARQALRTSLERTCGICTKHGCLDCSCGDDTFHGSHET